MLKTLIKKQMLELNRSFFQNSKNGKARSKAATILFITGYVLLVVVVLGGVFTAMANLMCAPLMAAQMDWLYFLIISGVAAALGLFGSVFTIYSALYMAKDNDLLLSMPIPVDAILVSRLTGVYLMDLMFVAVVMLPAIAIYAINGAAWTGVACAIAFMLALSLLVMCLACALGWVIAKVSVKMKNKSITTALISLLGIAIYYFAYAKAQMAIQDIIANSVVYGAAIQQNAQPLYLLGRAAAGNGIALLGFIIVVLALTALVWWIIRRSFIRLATMKTGTAKKAIRDVAMPQRGIDAALFGKEKDRFISSANYMLNCALGSVFMIVLGIAALIKGRDLIARMTQAISISTDTITLIAAAALCALVSMNDITAPSISLEGKSLWVVKSLPVPAWRVLRAKLRLHARLTCVPAAFVALCVAYALRADVKCAVLIVLLAVVFGMFGGALGLMLNLLKPNFSWTNETAVIKQSMTVLLTLVSGWGVVILLALAYYLLSAHIAPVVFMLFSLILLAALTGGMLVWIKKRGTKIFAAL